MGKLSEVKARLLPVDVKEVEVLQLPKFPWPTVILPFGFSEPPHPPTHTHKVPEHWLFDEVD